MTDTERITRRNLPHWYKPGHAHFVTYRQAGTIPLDLLRRWRSERDMGLRRAVGKGTDSLTQRTRLHKQFFARYDDYLDTHAADAVLTRPEIASMLRENLYHHAGKGYELLAWCIMSNHVHVVLQPFEFEPADEHSMPLGAELSDVSGPLGRVMHSLKSYTANRANEILGRSGRFWQEESYHHWVRDVDELARIVDYVNGNPVRAGLCRRPIDWPYSSAFDRHATDGWECGLVGWLRDDWRREAEDR